MDDVYFDVELEPFVDSEAVLIYIKLSDNYCGTPEDEFKIELLEEKLWKLMEETKVGEYDFHEYGAGYCTLFMYGDKAEKIYQAIYPIIKKFTFPRKSYLLMRYLTPEFKQEIMDLGVRPC